MLSALPLTQLERNKATFSYITIDLRNMQHVLGFLNSHPMRCLHSSMSRFSGGFYP